MSLKEKFEIEEASTKENEKQENHMALGMCFGVMFGAVGMVILSMSGQIAFGGLSVGVGLLIGMLVGMTIPKKK